jgi:hypothetical protein
VDSVAGPQASDLDNVAVDSGSICAFQIRQNDVTIIQLDFGVKTAHALIIEPEGVAFLPANGHGRHEILEHPPPIHAIQYLKRHRSHSSHSTPVPDLHIESLRLPHCQTPMLECQLSIGWTAFGQVAEPGDLPFSKVSTPGLDAFDGLFQIELSVKMSE